MYGLRELNLKRRELLKEFRGKYFTHIGRGRLYKVKGVVVSKENDSMRLLYIEVGVFTEFLDHTYQFKKLKPCSSYALYSRSPLNFKRNFRIVEDKNEAFKVAEKLN